MKLLFLHVINAKEQVFSGSSSDLRLIGTVIICAPLALLGLLWPASLMGLGMVSGLIGAGGQQQRRGSIHTG